MIDTYEKLLQDLAAGRLPSPVMNTRRLLDWGAWEELDQGQDYQVRRIEVRPGSRLSFEAPQNVRKNWVALSRGFEAVVNGEARQVEPGASLDLPPGAIHEIGNPTNEPIIILELLRGSQAPAMVCEPFKAE